MAKWRAISSAHRSEGVHNFYQAIRQKAPPVDKTQAGKTPYKPIRPGRPAHIIDNSQGLVHRLYENGYIRPKMIRIRLLHYWICRLLGELSGHTFVSSLTHSFTYPLMILTLSSGVNLAKSSAQQGTECSSSTLNLRQGMHSSMNIISSRPIKVRSAMQCPIIRVYVAQFKQKRQRIAKSAHSTSPLQ